MLAVTDLHVEVGGKFIVSELSFVLNPGNKVGLVGRNGAGKTSLLKVLAGAHRQTKGAVNHKGNLGYLGQDTLSDKGVAGDKVLSRVLSGRGLGELSNSIEEARVKLEHDPSEKNLNRYSRLIEEFEQRDGYRGESEAMALLAGLGLKENRFHLEMSAISGGERRRVELARILFGGSDLLFLDEPTNHLDVDAKAWLLNYLKLYQGVMIVVSHDLELLDESINRVFHLERGAGDGELIDFKGNYSAYQRAMSERRRQTAQIAHRQEEELTRLSRLADAMRHQSSARARAAKSIDSRAQRIRSSIDDIPKEIKTQKVTVKIPAPLPCGRVVLVASALCKNYGSARVLHGVEFTIERGERFLVAGFNGAGKSTLLNVLAKRLELDSGNLMYNDRVSVGYFAQEHEELQLSATPLEQVLSKGLTLTEAMGTLAAFGLVGDVVSQPTITLSGGEKTKLALGLLVAGRHNLLLLDEPTNNLDPDSRVAISVALSAWSGTMICVTHDAEFARQLNPSRVLVLPDGTIDHFNDSYLELIEMA